MTRSAYISHDHQLVIFWSQKVACTSIADRFIFEILGKDRSSLNEDPRVWLHRNGYEIHWSEALGVIENNGYKSIALFRAPYERLISSFIDKFCINGKGKPLSSFEDLEHFSQTLYLRIHGGYDGVYKGLSFRDFVMAISQVVRNRGDEEPKLDNHWNTQAPFFFLDNDFHYDYLFPLNRSGLFFRELSKITGKDLKPVHANRSHSAKSDLPVISLTDIPTVELLDQPDNIRKECFFDSHLRGLILHDFAPDWFYFRKAQEFVKMKAI